MAASVQLIVGLGNPGSRYEDTRHNAGFWFIDALIRSFGGDLKSNSRFHGEVGETRIAGERVRLCKPTTFMNRSGQAVAAVASFYRIPAETVLVVHDELDLPTGTIRLKRGGGEGGHNGLRDISPQLGTKNYLRFRIGIAHPGNANQVTDYVLKRPGADERRAIDDTIDRGLRYIEDIVRGDVSGVMNELNRKPKPAKADEPEKGDTASK